MHLEKCRNIFGCFGYYKKEIAKLLLYLKLFNRRVYKILDTIIE